MADTRLSTSIESLRQKLKDQIPNANAEQLKRISRSARKLGYTQDTEIETLLNTRANTLIAATNDPTEVETIAAALNEMDDTINPTLSTAGTLVGGASKIVTDDSAPGNPEDGDLWFKTDDLDLYVYYDDGDTSQWVQVNAASLGENALVTTSSSSPTNPVVGQLWFDTNNSLLYTYHNAQWVQVGGSGGSSSSIQWTRFYFDRGGLTPSAAISNSENVGKNFGSWTETTSANTGSTYVTPTSSTYDPTLTGITVNSNGEFQFPAGVYEVNASIQFKIYNSSSNLAKYDFYLYGESGSNWAGSYDEQLLVPSTSLLVNNDMMIKMNGLYVFENATQANNILYLQMGTSSQPVNANMFPDYGFLDIKKIG